MLEYRILPAGFDYLAPDGSEIRLLSNGKKGGMAHCTLAKGKISLAVSHKTVEEIWYIISGEGEMWQKSLDQEEVIPLSPEVSLTIPVGNHFQFRNTGTAPLCIIIATMPPWTDPDEAIFVKGHW